MSDQHDRSQRVDPMLQIVADLATLKAQTTTIGAQLATVQRTIDERLVTKELLDAKLSVVQRLVYGAAGLILAGAIAAAFFGAQGGP